MLRVLGPGILGLVFLVLWIYCVFDVIATDESLMRNLPKVVWLLIVIFVPTIGSVAWLALGRPMYAGWRPGDTEVHPPARRPVAPEDRADWSAARLADREAELRRREEELRKRAAEGNGPTDPGPPHIDPTEPPADPTV
jgi:hypothetical protein